MTEVDQIEERLRGPVNCWLNNVQQADFARLLQLARAYQALANAVERDQLALRREVPVYDRPPILPSF